MKWTFRKPFEEYVQEFRNMSKREREIDLSAWEEAWYSPMYDAQDKAQIDRIVATLKAIMNEEV